jgi:hypothetical protein
VHAQVGVPQKKCQRAICFDPPGLLAQPRWRLQD